MAVLRIHFTPDDLTKTRLTPDADLRWETALSLNLLQSREPEPAKSLTSWRSWARRRLGTWALPLLAAVPPAERFPAFVDLLQRDEHAELAYALQRYHTSVIEPCWPKICTAIAMDRAQRTRSLLEHGLEGLLDALTPLFRWRAPVLEREYPFERDLSLNGRGLVLVPSYFCSRPVILAEQTRPGNVRTIVLVHPIAPETRILIKAEQSRDRRPQGIDALLGTTRAAVLQALTDGCTTTELAQRVGISTATASQHATILRQAGLISTQRRGPSVLHIATSLGTAVLKKTG